MRTFDLILLLVGCAVSAVGCALLFYLALNYLAAIGVIAP